MTKFPRLYPRSIILFFKNLTQAEWKVVISILSAALPVREAALSFISFAALLEEVEDGLSFIKSNKINTYEMLYDANEMIKQAEEAEAENDKLAIQAALENPVSEDVHDTEAEALLDDPEEMIKLLKKRRGI